MSSAHRRTTSSRRKVTLWAISILVSLLLFVAVWITVRALMARDELLGAIPIANSLGSQVLSGNANIDADVAELQKRAKSASILTSDPIWTAMEVIPSLGQNLTAFREATAMISELADDALPQLSGVAGTMTVESMSPTNGAFDLEAFEKAQPLLSSAREALDRADQSARAIDTEKTVPQIGAAIDQVAGLVADAKSAVDNIETAASLLPTMLGGDGPRSYLLMSLNNAELRATGGLPGALAVINAEDGRLSLGTLSSATALGEFDSPVLELSGAERTLYGDVLGTYMHDVTYTPNFARSGELAQAMWLERTGQRVDGVLAVDPVALSYILEATGPIDSGEGIVLTKENAVDVLLSGVYKTFPEPADQDLYFANVIGSIFGSLMTGGMENSTLISALDRSAEENRIHLWSSNHGEQVKISGTPLAGAVPVSSDDHTAFGVYFNDATGAKMDYYLSSAIGIASAVCRNDGRPNFEVNVKMESRAPTDSAASLSDFVTGGGFYGVESGDIATNVFVYAPEGYVPYSVTIDGQEYAFVAADEGVHSVAGVTLNLSPGQQSEVSMKFVGLAGASPAVQLQHTPLASDVLTSLDNYLDCSSVVPAPVDGDEEQSGAMPGPSIGQLSLQGSEG